MPFYRCQEKSMSVFFVGNVFAGHIPACHDLTYYGVPRSHTFLIYLSFIINSHSK